MRARPGAGRMTFAEIAPAHVAEGRAVGPRCERDDRVMARIAASRGELGCPEDELPRALVEARVARRPGESETTGPCRADRGAHGPRARDLRLAPARRGPRGRAGEGADADAMMPVLAAHAGHADTRRAGCCLRPAAGTRPGMVARAGRECGWVVPP